MYCYKCGKQIPDNSAFCSECGADLKNPSSERKLSESEQNAIQNAGQIGVLIADMILSLIALCWALNTYSNDTSHYPFSGYTYQSPLTGHEIMVIALGLIGLSGVIGGIIGLCNPKFRNSNKSGDGASTANQNMQKTARKLDAGDGLVKCSLCGALQGSERTKCQRCGAEFIEP